MISFFSRSYFHQLIQKTVFFSRPIQKVIGWIPLTLRSLILIPLLILVRQSYGIVRNDFVVLVLSEGGLILIAFSILMVFLITLLLKFRKKISSGEIYQMETERAFLTEFKIHKIDWIPFIKLELNWKKPEGITAKFESRHRILFEEIIPTERGMEDNIIRQIKVIDLFGLAKIQFEESENRKIKIYPSLLNCSLKPIFKHLGGGDFISHPLGEPVGDRADLRRYVRGDPLKHILWKIYARTGKLMVREVEKAVSPEYKVFIYFIASPNDNIAASAVRTALEKGEFGSSFVFLAEGETKPTSHLPEAIEQIIRSIRAKNRSGEGLKSFFEMAQKEGGSHCFVFASAESFQWVNLLLSSVRSVLIKVDLILCGDETLLIDSQNFLRRFLLDAYPIRRKKLKRLESEVEKLVKEGVEVKSIDQWGKNLRQMI